MKVYQHIIRWLRSLPLDPNVSYRKNADFARALREALRPSQDLTKPH
jgi:hypothetical protein